VSEYVPETPESIPAIRTYFKAYVTSGTLRDTIAARQYTDLATNPLFSLKDYRAVPEPYRQLVPQYVMDYVSLNQFAA
jgi:type I restriction enzyme R subunit